MFHDDNNMGTFQKPTVQPQRLPQNPFSTTQKREVSPPEKLDITNQLSSIKYQQSELSQPNRSMVSCLVPGFVAEKISQINNEFSETEENSNFEGGKREERP